ncbi:MAG: hypothetical protein NC082_01255 [Clostridiales bacterium]|nr:hypothetical protein [Clostridiales bacterium]
MFERLWNIIVEIIYWAPCVLFALAVVLWLLALIFNPSSVTGSNSSTGSLDVFNGGGGDGGGC